MSLFLNVGWTTSLSLFGVLGGVASCQDRTTTAAPPSVHQRHDELRQFVRRVYLHGLPYEEAVSFAGTNPRILLEMLASQQETAFWSNIVLTLGCIGGAEAFPALKQFIVEGEGKLLSHDEYAAKTSAVTALGYVVYHGDDEDALRFLLESLDPEVWSERGVDWRSPYHSDDGARNAQLTSMAIMALALSGKAEARKALLQWREAATSAEKTHFASLVDEAIEANEFIAARGLIEYYRR